LKVAISAALCAVVFHAVAAGPRPIEEQVLDAARSVLDDRAGREGWVDPQYELVWQRPREPVSPCRKALAIEPVDTRQASRLRLEARCADSPGWAQTFTVKATVSARVAVAAVALPSGRTIGTGDIAVERRDITAVPDALSDPAAAVGQASRRPLRSGDVLRSAWLAAPVLVKRGDAVRIVAQRDNVTVTVPGEAQEAGALGAIVRVRNVGNGRIIRARVVEAGVVQPADL